MIRCTYLDEARWVEFVLGRDLQPNRATGFGVPGGLCTSLDLSVDLVVIARGEDAQVVRGGDGSGVERGAVSKRSTIFRDCGLLHIVSDLTTGEVAFVSENGIEGGGGALEGVDEGAEIDVGLLVEEVEFAAVVLVFGQEGRGDLGFETLDNVVLELELCVEDVGGGPSFGKGDAWSTEPCQ